MFTATPLGFSKDNGILGVRVEFSDGIETFEEVVKPQNEEGLKYWIISRLEQLNSNKELEQKQEILNVPFDVSEPVQTEKVLTPEQIYLQARSILMEHKLDLDLGLITQSQYNIELEKVKALRK